MKSVVEFTLWIVMTISSSVQILFHKYIVSEVSVLLMALSAFLLLIITNKIVNGLNKKNTVSGLKVASLTIALIALIFAGRNEIVRDISSILLLGSSFFKILEKRMDHPRIQ